MHFNVSWVVAISLLFDWVVRIVALFVVPRNRKPSSATAWLLLIMIFPTLGLLIFLLIGSPKLSRRRRAAQHKMDEVIAAAVKEARSDPKLRQFVHFDVPERIRPFANLTSELGGMPPFSGNKIELLPVYDESIARIVKDVRSAKLFAHIEFFALAMDDTTEDLFVAMTDAVKRGVSVRVLFDTLGSHKYPRFKEMKQRMTAAGIEWHPMLPIRLPGKHYTRPDLRNHRKIAVIDARVGYTGSQNLIQRNYHRKDKLYYDELMARIEGPVVAQFHAIFITDWYSETGQLLNRAVMPEIRLSMHKAGDTLAQVMPSGPAYDNDNNLKLFTSLIHAAKEKLVITNPYFVPDVSLLDAITGAAQRGVEVTMINSAIMDQAMVGHAQRSYYEELLKAGVKIYWYKRPVLLHAKHITIDDDIAVIGSSNLDIRSFELDLEVTLIAYDKKVVSNLRKIEAGYLTRSKLVTLKLWQRRTQSQRLLDNLARLTAALQ